LLLVDHLLLTFTEAPRSFAQRAVRWAHHSLLGDASHKELPAWETKLWSTTAPRNRILVAWGHRANVVLTDDVEYSGFIQAVIVSNAR